MNFIYKLLNGKDVIQKGGEYTIFMGSVTYGHKKVRARKANSSTSFSGDDAVFTKRQCFEHEKELRLVMYVNDIKTPVLSNETGLKINVDLESLISEVIISPEAPSWMEDLVRRVTKQYGLSFEIRSSTLHELII